MASDEPNIGNSRKITGVKPKFYIKDNGTDYTDGEEYNGLWSGGTNDAPTGYGNIGDWKLNEEEGDVAFNNRVRGHTDLFCAGTEWSSDGTGNYLQFNLAGNSPLLNSSPNYYIMLGTGGTHSESAAFDDFLGANTGGTGFQAVRGYTEGKLFFNFWAYFRKPPASDGIKQVFLYTQDRSGSFDARMRFFIKNISGVIHLCFAYIDTSGNGTDRVSSAEAGNAIFPKGLAEDGGLHHVAFCFDRTQLDSGDIIFDTAPYGFYVDGIYYGATTGSTASWEEAAITMNDTNALIGCETDGTNPTYTADKYSGGPKFENHFTGKFYHIQMSSPATGEITEDRMRMLHGLKFDIPRGPTPVDMSERYEYDGKNLLQDIGTINQVIGNEKGAFYVNINQVKVRN